MGYSWRRMSFHAMRYKNKNIPVFRFALYYEISRLEGDWLHEVSNQYSCETLPPSGYIPTFNYRYVWIIFYHFLLNWKKQWRTLPQHLCHLKTGFLIEKTMLHCTFIVVLKKKRPSILIKCWNIFVFYIKANWTQKLNGYTIVRRVSGLIWTDCPIILLNSKNHKQNTGKQL